MLFNLLAQVPTTASEGGPWVTGGATVILAGVVVWLAKAYRDDMKERAAASLVSHEKVVADFKVASEQTRDKFLAALDRHGETITELCDSVRSLNCPKRP